MSFVEKWILTVFAINPELESLARNVEREIAVKAKRVTVDTVADINNVLRLVNAKNAYCNLRVIYNSFLEVLSAKERDVLLSCAAKVSVSDIARNLGVQRNTVYRILKKAFAKCKKVLKELDYTEKELEREFMWLTPVHEIFEVKKAA